MSDKEIKNDKKFLTTERKFHKLLKKTIASIDEDNTRIDNEYQKKITLVFIALHLSLIHI